MANHAPLDLEGYRLGRIAAWSQPRYRLDGRFVALTLWVDQGEDASGGRWAPKPERFDDLGAVLAQTPEPAAVILGPPGAGKSTLLRRLELDTAVAAIRGGINPSLHEAGDRLTFFIQLNQYKPNEPGQPVPAPAEWLAARWAAAYPALPALDDFLATGRMILLLDALNEMPAASEREFRDLVVGWKDWLVRLTTERPGNRVIFSCRTLDYSAPLSTPALRVPQIQIEPLNDAQVREFLTLYSPVRGEEIWSVIAGTPQLEALRAPYFLALLVNQVEATGDLAADRAGLFTGFVRQALRREVERDSPLFALEALISGRDLRRIAQWQWRGDYDLLEHGVLVPKLAALAYGLQDQQADGGASQVRVDYELALELLDHARDEDILKAGVAISVLDEDPAVDEVLYRHQLLQEYFAARVLARSPRPELVATPWQATRVQPPLREVLASLPPAETLPTLPTTGWEETTVLAAQMAPEPEPFLRDLMPANLALAGRAAHLLSRESRLSPAFLDDLRRALIERSREPAADLRARIEAARVLGSLGDPRFARHQGPAGDYLVPPVVTIPAGNYPMGDDEPVAWVGGITHAHVPRHSVAVSTYQIGRFPVTNAEYGCFVAAGGCDDDRWWTSAAARDWRRGIGTAAGMHASFRHWAEKFRAEPSLMDDYLARGNWNEELYERWQQRLAMTEAQFTAMLFELHPEKRFSEPKHWREERFNQPTQPVVGVSWYEARAYCAWLSHQSGDTYRLPTEVEWESAARGHASRAYAYGADFDPLAANTAATKLRRTTPVGVFVEGDTPEGVSDLTGNVDEWMSSAFGTIGDEAEFAYPYAATDGREDPDLGPAMRRVVRGGSWMVSSLGCLATCRNDDLPDFRLSLLGFRLVRDGASDA